MKWSREFWLNISALSVAFVLGIVNVLTVRSVWLSVAVAAVSIAGTVHVLAMGDRVVKR